MAKQENVELDGIVIDCLKAGMFMVEIETNTDTKHHVLCTLSGKMRKNYIKVLLGDKVDVKVSPYDLSKGIITYRYK